MTCEQQQQPENSPCQKIASILLKQRLAKKLLSQSILRNARLVQSAQTARPFADVIPAALKMGFAKSSASRSFQRHCSQTRAYQHRLEIKNLGHNE